MKQLILGGARSGKSSLAEKLAKDSGLTVCYIATATADDYEMLERIQQHQARRPADWHLIESPVELASAISKHAAEDRCLLVDCLTLWLSNLLLLGDPQRLKLEKTALLNTLSILPGEIIMVSNETGQGVVPMGQLTRRFVDEAGWLHQAVAEASDRVIFTIAGLPQVLKGPPL